MMSWAFPVVQGFELHKLRRASQKSSTRGSVSVKSRHEPVSLPESQSASRPERLVTQPCPDCSSRPLASRPSFCGRGVGLVFLWCALPFSSLFCRFSVLVSRELSRSRGCAVATSAIRGVSLGVCAASPCSGKVPPDSRDRLLFLCTKPCSAMPVITYCGRRSVADKWKPHGTAIYTVLSTFFATLIKLHFNGH